MPSKGCPDGAPEVPFGDEVADRDLLQHRRVPRSQCPDRLEVMHRVERKHSISQAERRKQYVAENCPHREPTHCHRALAAPESVVPSSDARCHSHLQRSSHRLPRPLKQAQTPSQALGGSQRKLVARCDG